MTILIQNILEQDEVPQNVIRVVYRFYIGKILDEKKKKQKHNK